MNTTIKSTFLAFLLLGAPHAVLATTLNCGPNICYQYNETQSAIALFGTPVLIGDSMRFLPSVFRAESNNNTGSVSTASTSANFIFDQVWATTSGAEIGSVQVLEAGDYSISNDNGGVPDAVGVTLSTRVGDNSSSEFVIDNVSFIANGDSSGARTWALQGNAINPAIAFTASAQNISIQIQNTLTATTDEFGGDAWIQKKFTVVVGTEVPPPVPLPPTLPLLLTGVGMLGVNLRRRIAG